jgi:hypothetical protein
MSKVWNFNVMEFIVNLSKTLVRSPVKIRISILKVWEGPEILFLTVSQVMLVSLSLRYYLKQGWDTQQLKSTKVMLVKMNKSQKQNVGGKTQVAEG